MFHHTIIVHHVFKKYVNPLNRYKVEYNKITKLVILSIQMPELLPRVRTGVKVQIIDDEMNRATYGINEVWRLEIQFCHLIPSLTTP